MAVLARARHLRAVTPARVQPIAGACSCQPRLTSIRSSPRWEACAWRSIGLLGRAPGPLSWRAPAGPPGGPANHQGSLSVPSGSVRSACYNASNGTQLSLLRPGSTGTPHFNGCQLQLQLHGQRLLPLPVLFHLHPAVAR